MSNIPERLEGFLVYLKSVRNKSDETIKGYECDLRMFFKYTKHRKLKLKSNIEDVDISNIDDKFIKSITEEELDGFIIYLSQTRKNGAGAVARKIASIKAFYFYLAKKKIIQYNIAAQLETPKLAERQPIYLTLDQANNVVKALKSNDSDPNQIRDECIISIFINCGVRLSELVAIDIKDIDLDQEVMRVIGKGNKERTAYFNENVLESLEKYLEIRKQIDSSKIENNEDKDALFLSKKYNRISKRAVENVVRKYIDLAGLDSGKFTPHKLRHTAATLMYQHGHVDIRELQRILGHENVSTTQIYTHVDDKQLHNAVKTIPRLG